MITCQCIWKFSEDILPSNDHTQYQGKTHANLNQRDNHASVLVSVIFQSEREYSTQSPTRQWMNVWQENQQLGKGSPHSWVSMSRPDNRPCCWRTPHMQAWRRSQTRPQRNGDHQSVHWKYISSCGAHLCPEQNLVCTYTSEEISDHLWVECQQARACQLHSQCILTTH